MHCENTLTEVLVPLVGETNLHIDLETHTISVKGNVDWDTIADAIRKAGYSPSKQK
jgi:copper chaperone CopZ